MCGARRGRRGPDTVMLNATGYIIAAHKIQVASKVLGRVAWIGVDKGDRVREGQVIVRLEDDEYRAQLQQAKGQLAALEARLAEMLNGSRPEEIARAKADVAQARADVENARVTLGPHTRTGRREGVFAKQSLDDAQARYDARWRGWRPRAHPRAGADRPAQGADRRRARPGRAGPRHAGVLRRRSLSTP